MPSEPRCPICRKPSVREHGPFCSRGCKDRDLINWLSESYRAPASEEEDSETPLDSESDPRL